MLGCCFFWEPILQCCGTSFYSALLRFDLILAAAASFTLDKACLHALVTICVCTCAQCKYGCWKSVVAVEQGCPITIFSYLLLLHPRMACSVNMHAPLAHGSWPRMRALAFKTLATPSLSAVSMASQSTFPRSSSHLPYQVCTHAHAANQDTRHEAAAEGREANRFVCFAIRPCAPAPLPSIGYTTPV